MTQANITQTHEVNPAETDATGTTYLCTCGWVTIGYHNPPDYHVPVEDRIAEHLDDADAIDSGRAWAEVASIARYYEVYVGRSVAGPQAWLGIRAVWMGGSRIVATMPARDGADYAGWVQQLTSSHRVERLTWAHTGFPVTADDLNRIHV